MVLNALYEEKGSLDDGCRYCGQAATGWDHIPPLRYVAGLVDSEIDTANLRKVPSCRECNVWLGGNVLLTVKERRKYIRRKFRSKYERFLRIPGWDAEELNDLGYALETHVSSAIRLTRVLRARWENLNGR